LSCIGINSIYNHSLALDSGIHVRMMDLKIVAFYKADLLKMTNIFTPSIA